MAKQNNMANLIVTLTVIGLISALVLSFVYLWTTPKINAHQAQAKEIAVKAVLPGAEEIKESSKEGLTFYEGYQNGNRVGVAMVVSGGGFQGTIELILGVNPSEGKIYGIEILSHSETPGLGANIETKSFRSNFENKPFGTYTVVKRPAKDPLEVEAISGATISSEKVTKIVEKAIQDIERIYGGGA